ncbi:MAG: FAD-binding oxidoreductase, partial [Bacteroidales bacterium]|nr:FAD-binding oxidoreductase [Bacteroidales bacterium]
SKGKHVLVIDIDKEPFMRGSYINQARLHNGYHYPRSFSTATKSAKYFDRFLKDFSDCVNQNFEQIYAIAKHYSWTNGTQFEKFCRNVGVRCEQIPIEKYFNKNTVEKVFVTREFTFDAIKIKERFLRKIRDNDVELAFNTRIKSVRKIGEEWNLILSNNHEICTPFVLNASYAGTNQVHHLFNFEMIGIKYELCEVILCNVSDMVKNIGLTLMDGPFFSLMPFGMSGYHSITTVSKTPHNTSLDMLPNFACMKKRNDCSPEHTANCNHCSYHPYSAFKEMYQTAKKYINSDIKIEYVKSLFTLKPILKSSEIDDSRPTIIRQLSEKPDFYTVFSGKINTMYDLDTILNQ